MAKLVACGFAVVWVLCLVEGMYGEVSDGVASYSLDPDTNLQIRDVGEHYIDLIHDRMVKVNYALIPLYENVMDKFTRSIKLIHNMYNSVAAVHMTTTLEAISECEALEESIGQQTVKVQTSVLQCVSRGTTSYMLTAANAAQKIRDEANGLRDAPGGQHSVERLQSFAEKQLATLTVNATRVANDAYLCFTQQTAMVAKEIGHLMDMSKDCIKSFSNNLELLSND